MNNIPPVSDMPAVLLCTLNARYIHSSLGLRCLKANMGELAGETEIVEFTLEPWPIDMAERLLALEPRIIGFGVYIWNIEQTTRLVMLLKRLRPDITLVLGGPEISHEWQEQEIARHVDHIIPGQADLLFAGLCRDILGGVQRPWLISGERPDLKRLALPYPHYTDEDIAQRIIYVEASRGCPFKCEFCISALDRSAWGFDLGQFLAAMQRLYERGARHFKFVDRTFNLDPKTATAILSFFIERIDSGIFLHFEIVPDRLPEALKRLLVRFPPGSLQFEVGIQSFNPQVQTLISRRQDEQKTRDNLLWLRRHTQAHIHADLIIGLPGESWESFARGFDRLLALGVHEIQLGVLKRLRGTPIIRHTRAFDMRYNPSPPYDILSNNLIGFERMQQLNRFARYWEMIANSGRFSTSLPLLLGDAPFARFHALSRWLFDTTGQVHRIALKRLFELLFEGGADCLGVERNRLRESLMSDFEQSGIKGLPASLHATPTRSTPSEKAGRAQPQARQLRHRPH